MGLLRSIEDHCGSLRVETIVVDNGSSDGSVEAVRGEFPRVKLIVNGENLGFARASNIGIRECHGRYISLINSDVVIMPGCIEALKELLDKQPDIGIAGPRILGPDGTPQVSCGDLPNPRGALCDAVLPLGVVRKSGFLGRILGVERNYSGPTDVQMLSGCFWFVRREAVDQVGLLDERFFIYSEDCDWCKRFHDNQWRVVFSPASEAIHLGEGSSSIAPIRFYLEMQKARFAYWEKHHGFLGKAYYGVMLVLHEVIRLGAGSVLYVVDAGARPRHGALVVRSVSCLLWLFHLREGR